jgi:hypothetical protein
VSDFERWRADGKTYRHRGHDIFYRDQGDGPPLVLLVASGRVRRLPIRGEARGLVAPLRCPPLSIVNRFGISVPLRQHSAPDVC